MEKILAPAIRWLAWYQKEIIFGAIIFIAATVSFALGYLANRESNHAPIIIEKCAAALLPFPQRTAIQNLISASHFS